MKMEWYEAVVMLTGVFGSGVIIGLVLGNNESWWKAETIKRGIAKYNEKTGVWEWIKGSTEERS